MTESETEFFLYVGSADSESTTTRLRASGVRYQKKLLSSKPANWVKIVDMISSPHCRGVLVVLRAEDYNAICSPTFNDPGRAFLDALAKRPHVVLVHEAVFLSAEQRAAAAIPAAEPQLPGSEPVDDEDEIDRYYRTDFFRDVSEDVRASVNEMLRERGLNVSPYRTNVERSIIASGFLDDNERKLLFRIYVPKGRLYAQEADALLGLFREWLGEKGHTRVRQDGYSTAAGQVFEFFDAEGKSDETLEGYFEDFSKFLDDCVFSPDAAAMTLISDGVIESMASIIVSRFATRVRRINLDLKQRREERMLSLKHELENVVLEAEGVRGDDLMALLNQMLPAAAAHNVIETPQITPGATVTVNHYNSQFIREVDGHVVQNLAGTINLGFEAKQLLDLVAQFGGNERGQLETAVHEMEDEGARPQERVAARSRLKRFLADIGSRGLGIGLDVLQKYVEHKVGIG